MFWIVGASLPYHGKHHPHSLSRYWPLALCWSVTLGCANPDTDTAAGSAAQPSASTALPSLRFDAAVNKPVSEDLTRYSTVLVGPDGQVLFSSPRDAEVMTLRFRSGQFVTFGPLGDGPGEIRDPLGYQVGDSSVVVLDRSNRRLSFWSMDGELLDEKQVDIPISPEVVPIGGNRWLLPGAIRDRVRVAILDGATGKLSEISLANDSFVNAHWGNPRLAAQNPPALGKWSGGFLIGNRMTYSIAFFDWNGSRIQVLDEGRGLNQPGPDAIQRIVRERELTGRPLSPAAKAALGREAQPWFSRRVRADGSGRTWLIGESNDSAYADVYADTRLIGRLALPCQDIGPFWDLTGNWLAVVCAPDDSTATVDAVVKLFEIK